MVPIRSGITLLGLGLVSASFAQATTDDFVRQAVRKGGDGRVDLIVRTDAPLTKADQVRLSKIGGYVYRDLSIIKSTAVSVPKRKLSKFLGLPFVRHVSMDVRMTKTDAYTVGASHADVAWTDYGATGKGVGVAILDTGIRSSADFRGRLLGSRVVASANFSPDAWSADDKTGHGTHVAGIVAGNGANSSGAQYFQSYSGVAPQAHLMNVRVLDSNGGGTVSQVVAGIAWVIANRPLYNIRVMNISVGHEVGESYKTDPLCQAVELAWKSGIVVVCAAGNEGQLRDNGPEQGDNEGLGTNYGSILSPANDPYVLTVGAMKRGSGDRATDRIATYSSRGPSRLDFVVKPDIVAPGEGIVSVMAPKSTYANRYASYGKVALRDYVRGASGGFSDDYFRMSGTSMAAPVVAGAAALMLQKHPLLTPDMVKARLMVSADKWVHPDGTADLFTYGAGYLNIPAALESNLFTLCYAKSPTAARGEEGVILIDLAQSLLDGSFWGTGVSDTRAMWGSRAMWGTAARQVPPNRAMWGTSVWTNSSTYRVNEAKTLMAPKGDRK